LCFHVAVCNAAADDVNSERGLCDASRLPYDKVKSISTGDMLETSCGGSGTADWLLDRTSPASRTVQPRVTSTGRLATSDAAAQQYHFTVRYYSPLPHLLQDGCEVL